MPATAPQPLIPPLPAWLANARDWLWLLGAAGAAWIIFHSRGSSD